MADEPKKYHYFFIHNAIGDFFHATLDYFGPYLYERFKYKVVSTYDKAVEFLSKQEQYDRETDMPMLPAIILDPSGEMGTADAIAGGKQLWRYPNLVGNFAGKYLFDPVYQDEDVMVNVGFSRIKGTFTLLMLTNSFYEYCDLRIFMIQQMGDLERYIYPIWFTTFVILPERFVNYEYVNPVTGKSHTLNWDSAGAFSELVRTTNINELVIPAKIKPIYKMTNMSDGSTRYGGTDKLADWRLSIDIEYEVEIPSFLIINTDYLVDTVKTNFYISSTTSYSDNAMFNNMMSSMSTVDQSKALKYIKETYGETYTLSDVRRALITDDTLKRIIPKEAREAFFGINPDKKTPEILDFESHEHNLQSSKTWDTGLDSTSSGTIDLNPDKIVKLCSKDELKFKTRYFHIVTKSESESTTSFNITIPEVVTVDKLVLIGKSGPMTYGSHYTLSTDGITLTILTTNVDLRENDMLELFIYDYE